MKNVDQSPEPGLHLVGWKRIGAHLGCSERTARRWEREEGLPVHRQLHGTKSSVYADPRELNAWRASRSPQTKSYDPDAEDSRRGFSKVSTDKALAGTAIALLIVLAGIAIFRLGPLSPHDPALSEDPNAADLYARGMALWEQRGAVPNARAIKLFEQATTRDPAFAEAWSALAFAWVTYPTYDGEVSEADSLNKAKLSADRALALDASLAEPRIVKALIAQRERAWLKAEEVFEEALQAAPENATVYLWYGQHFRDVGLLERSDALLAQALDLDPNLPPAQLDLAMNTIWLDVEDAKRKLRYLWFDTGFEAPVVWAGLWMCLLVNQELEAASQWVGENAFYPQHSDLFLRFVSALRSPSAQSRAAVGADLANAYENGLPGWLAFYLLASLGLADGALDIAEAEADTGRFEASIVMFAPQFANLRQSDRFAAITERLGYVAYWRQRGAPAICQNEADTPVCLLLAETPTGR